MNCVPNVLAMSARCFCFPKRTAQRVWIYLLCQWAHRATSDTTPAGLWAARVVANGGAAPSDATKAILNTFYNDLNTAGIVGKMISVVCFVPGDLIAALTPFILTAGNDPWINHGFVGPGTDLTVDGLQGNGTTKYLETGVFPASSSMTDTLAGLTVYNTLALNQNGTDMGCQQAGGLPIMQLIVSFGDQNAYWDCWNTTVGQGRVSGNDNVFRGYVSGNRTAARAKPLVCAPASSASPWVTL